MIRLIRAELQKMLTIRSTYVLLLFCLAITVFFAFYIEGFKPSENVANPGKLASEVTSAVNALVLFITLVGVLLVTHEYRYSTIMYTLTSSSSRLKILLAKIIAVSGFTVVVTLLFAALSPLLTYAGIQLKGLEMVPQSIPYVDLLWRTAFYGWGYAMLAMLLAFIIRQQVGAIVALLLIPTTVEALLSLLLKKNVVYLPFNALNNVLNGGAPSGSTTALLSAGESARVAGLYIVIAGLVAAYLFWRRDAN